MPAVTLLGRRSPVSQMLDLPGCRCGLRIDEESDRESRLRHRPDDVRHIRVVEEIKGFHAGLRGEALADVKESLQADVGIEVRGSAVRVATYGSRAVGEEKPSPLTSNPARFE